MLDDIKNAITNVGPLSALVRFGLLFLARFGPNIGSVQSDRMALVATHLLRNTLEQGWATLFDSRATSVTNLVDAGQYKYNKDLFDMTFEKKCAFSSPFSQKKRL